MIGRPLLMLVPMDEDRGQFPGAVGFVVVVVNVRPRPDEPRRHRGSEEQKGGGESLPCTHAGIVAYPRREVKRPMGLDARAMASR